MVGSAAAVREYSTKFPSLLLARLVRQPLLPLLLVFMVNAESASGNDRSCPLPPSRVQSGQALRPGGRATVRVVLLRNLGLA